MLNYTCLHFEDLTPGELYDILSLRQEVFIIEQTCIYQDADIKDKSCWHVMGQDFNNDLLAYTRIIHDKNDSVIHIGRVVTDKKIRRTGEGKTLMENSIEFAIELFGNCLIKISAQSYLKHFYQNLGFNTIGKEYLEDGIPHIAMEMQT